MTDANDKPKTDAASVSSSCSAEVGPQRASPNSSGQIMASLRQFAEDVKEAIVHGKALRCGVCKNCGAMVNHEFMKLPNAQTAYPVCECGERVQVMYFQ